MKNLFPGHFPLSEEELSHLMQDAIFVFDTNVLLNMYRYTEPARNHFFEIAGRLGKRIVIPYQVACEFFDSRTKVIQDQNKAIDLMDKAIEDAHKKIKNDLNQFRRHAHVDIAKILGAIGNSLSSAQSDIRRIKEGRSPVKFNDDPILQRLADLLADNVLPEPTEDELNKRKKAAGERIKSDTPPGFLDRGKSGDKSLGDTLIWFETIEASQKNKLPVIFVTDDIKEDWWLRVDGQVIGPLPALRQEFHKATGQHFHMYQAENFIKHAAELLKIPVDQGALSEVAKVSADQAKSASDEELTPFLNELVSAEQASASNPTLKMLGKISERLERELLALSPSRPLLQEYSLINKKFIPVGDPRRFSIPDYTEKLMREVNRITWVPELDGFYGIVQSST
ncbi:hypothetical protein GO998_07670 [Ralstonia syzygii]|uniref:PIN like domain-containing protein n=1 Tax=Ralstonia syzygii TaxID=28097 RepID=A0ABX7ZFK2_9RALS|nr:PIN domain-containing protein [Ralstonia syzygii]QUP53644.1 hypothetical protein GO998_07670 [Ralstonia syzygii]